MDLVTTPNDRRRFEVLGVPVDACRDVAAAAIGLQASGGGRVVTLNAEMTWRPAAMLRWGRRLLLRNW